MNILQNTLFPRENEFSPEGFESFLASREFESIVSDSINQIHDLHESNDNVKNITLRFANGDEKAMLVNALYEEGKRWDGKVKAIVNKKRQIADNESEEESHKFELFDKVLVKGPSENDTWFPGFFFKECKDSKEYRYVTICGKYYTCCIPYNDKTKHLIGTTLSYDED